MKRAGVLAFAARRLSGVVLTIYLAVYLGLLQRGPRGFVTGMGRRGGPAFAALELALILVMTFHAVDGLGQVWLERSGAPQRHPTVLRVALISSVMIGLLHAHVLFFG